MKKLKPVNACFMLMLITCIFVSAQEESQVDRATVPFSNPAQPGFLKASVLNGSITVKGYDGQEVIVEARARSRKFTRKRDESQRTAGMRLLSVPTTGLEVTEEDNVMRVSTQAFKRSVDLNIQVPFATSLKLSGVNNGFITVENVSGEIEVNHVNGELTVLDVSGSVVAHTTNGEVKATFKDVDSEKPMSFSTFNGDIDVTFPAALRADVKMKSDQGDIYSDFDIAVKQAPKKVEEPKRESGRYRISFEKYVYGSINGGGPEFHFKTFNGDIMIRKVK